MMSKRSTGFGLFLLLALVLGLAAVFFLQPPRIETSREAELAAHREATGGAQTLEDILARQRGETIDDSFRSSDVGFGADPAGVPQLGTLGGASDPELWRGVRYDNLEDVRVSTRSDVGKVLVQDGGMRWWQFREGPLATWGGFGLLGTIGLLALFFLLRGRVRIEGGKAGTTVTRFAGFERFAHWLTAGSFILLGVTGLLVLFGRMFIAPYLGKEVNATLLVWSKLIHNNVSWAFMLGLVLIFFLWVWHNIPNRLDLVWFKQAGGIFGKQHPPAEKFNAGQKIIFWSVVIFGFSISLSGLSLLFPFEIPLFAKTFGIVNELGLPGWVGMGPLPTDLAPQEEMQLSQVWHGIVAFLFMAIIFAHIYIGSLGMEGAFDAMGSGQVDENWAEQHHSIWYAKVKAKEAGGTAPAPHSAPAE
jgi:formate dehydrogenase subunit gamma